MGCGSSKQVAEAAAIVQQAKGTDAPAGGALPPDHEKVLRAHFTSKVERQDPPPARPKDEGDTIDPDDLRRALSSRSLTKSMTFKVRDAEKEAEIDDAPFEDLGYKRNNSFFVKEQRSGAASQNGGANGGSSILKGPVSRANSVRSLKSHVSFAHGGANATGEADADSRGDAMSETSTAVSAEKRHPGNGADADAADVGGHAADPDLDDPAAFSSGGPVGAGETAEALARTILDATAEAAAAAITSAAKALEADEAEAAAAAALPAAAAPAAVDVPDGASAAARVAGGGEARASGSGTVRTSGSGAVRTSGSGAVRTSGSGAVRTSGSGAVRTSGSGAVRTSGSGAVRTSGSGAVRASGSGAARVSAGGA